MSSRAAGVALALIAAVLLAVSAATAAWYHGHPTVDGHLRELQTVHVSLHGAELCNTGGDKSCHHLRLDTAFSVIGWLLVAMIGLAALLSGALGASGLGRERHGRNPLARLAAIGAGIAALLAVILMIVGPTKQGSIPFGYSLGLFWIGAAASAAGAWASSRASQPVRLRSAPTGTIDARLPSALPSVDLPLTSGIGANGDEPRVEVPPPFDVNALFGPEPVAPPMPELPTVHGQLFPVPQPAPPRAFVSRPPVPVSMMPMAQLPELPPLPTPPPFDRPSASPFGDAARSGAAGPFDPPTMLPATPAQLPALDPQTISISMSSIEPVTRPPAPPRPPLPRGKPSSLVPASAAASLAAKKPTMPPPLRANAGAPTTISAVPPLPAAITRAAEPDTDRSGDDEVATRPAATTEKSPTFPAPSDGEAPTSPEDPTIAAAPIDTNGEDGPTVRAQPRGERQEATTERGGPDKRPPLSTAPDSLPPPTTQESGGPAPACPQCDAPMAWVEEHLRFYCKSCRMYF
ncbi:MAG TPA: hypothetical protein VGM88_04345 [Kofleriaceae bacterium]|jgi:hypothetical protein